MREWRGPRLALKLASRELPVVWSQPMGGGYSGITISGGRAYTMDRETGRLNRLPLH